MLLSQLVYASRATFTPLPASMGVEPHVGRILQQSRRNNPRRKLSGVLYYGDGCFFQCLEGAPAAIDSLVEVLQRDERHKDFRVIYRAVINRRQFDDWSMKYVPTSHSVQDFLRREGMQRFDPYQFDRQVVKRLLVSLSRMDGPDAEAAAAAAPAVSRKGILWITAGVIAALAAGGLLWALS